MRAGAKALTLLGAPRTYLILRALAGGAQSQIELRRAAGSPAQSTLRGHIDALADANAIAKSRRDKFPGALEYELTEPGHELLEVADHLDRWLGRAPGGPVDPGSDSARAAVKSLVDGWLARILAPLATGPLSLTELDRRLNTVSYPTLERRLEALRLTEQVEVKRRTGNGTPYMVNTWLRQGIAPLAAAARWELRNDLDDTTPIKRLEVESALKLARPLLKLPSTTSGLCQMAVRAPSAKQPRRRHLGMLEVRDGELTSFSEVYPEHKPDARASGAADAWFAAVFDGNMKGLRLNGDTALPKAILATVRSVLFEAEQSARSRSY